MCFNEVLERLNNNVQEVCLHTAQPLYVRYQRTTNVHNEVQTACSTFHTAIGIRSAAKTEIAKSGMTQGSSVLLALSLGKQQITLSRRMASQRSAANS